MVPVCLALWMPNHKHNEHKHEQEEPWGEPRGVTVSRRHVVASALLGTSAASLAVVVTPTPAKAAEEYATSAGRKGCTTISDPSRTTVTCLGETLDVQPPTVERRLGGIAATANGVSTSAIKNPSRYTPPWLYSTETDNAARAWTSLRTVVLSWPDVRTVSATEDYLHVTVPTAQPPGIQSLDDLEFLLRPDDNLVLVRSASRTSVFVYPLTQPVSDGNSNLQRLEKIRKTLGWSLLE